MEAVEKLEEASAGVLAEEPVLFAYLYGSHATGTTHPRSDVDVAVFATREVPPEGYLEMRLRLAAALGDAARIPGVEVLVLNDAPLPVRGRAVRDGVLIYSRDEPARVRYEGKTLKEFFDFQSWISFGAA